MTAQTKITIIGWAGFILCLILFLQRCGTGCRDLKPIISHDTIKTKLYDSVPKYISLKVPGPFRVDTFKIPAIIDTEKILQAYYNINYYSQPFTDSSISGSIQDTVTQNKIIGTGIKYKWLKSTSYTTVINTTKIDTTIIVQPLRSLYVGGFLSGNTDGITFGIGPSASFITKKQTLYSLGYDVLHQRIEFGAQIRLGKRKK